MTNTPFIRRCWVVAGFATVTALWLAVTSAMAIEPGEGNAGVFQVLFESDTVRVVMATTQPGQEEGWHSHPKFFVYVIQGSTARLTDPDGSHRDQVRPSGFTASGGPVKSHQLTNVGTTVMQTLVVEMKAE